MQFLLFWWNDIACGRLGRPQMGPACCCCGGGGLIFLPGMSSLITRVLVFAQPARCGRCSYLLSRLPRLAALCLQMCVLDGNAYDTKVRTWAEQHIPYVELHVSPRLGRRNSGLAGGTEGLAVVA